MIKMYGYLLVIVRTESEKLSDFQQKCFVDVSYNFTWGEAFLYKVGKFADRLLVLSTAAFIISHRFSSEEQI